MELSPQNTHLVLTRISCHGRMCSFSFQGESPRLCVYSLYLVSQKSYCIYLSTCNTLYSMSHNGNYVWNGSKTFIKNLLQLKENSVSVNVNLEKNNCRVYRRLLIWNSDSWYRYMLIYFHKLETRVSHCVSYLISSRETWSLSWNLESHYEYIYI